MSVYNTKECHSNSTQCDTNETKYHVLITNKSKCFKDCQPETNVHLRNESLVKVFKQSNSFYLGANLNWKDKTVLNYKPTETSNKQWKEKTRETSHESRFCHHNTCFRRESSVLFANDKQIINKEMNTRSLNRETCFDKELFSFVNNDLNADTKPAEINNFIDLSHLFESFCADTREEDNNLNLCMTPDSLILSTKNYVDNQNNDKFDRGLCGDEIENYHDVNANQMPYLHDMSTGDNGVSSKDLRLPFNDKTLKANKHSNNRLLFLEYLLESEARVTQNKKCGAALKRKRQLRKLQSKRNLKTNLTCRRLSLWGNKDDHFLHDALNIKQIKPMMKHTKTQQYIMKHDMKSSSRIDPNCTVLNDIELSNVSLQSPEIHLTSSSLNTFDKLSDMSSSSLSPDSLETLNSVTESLKDFSPYGTLQPCQVFTTDANIKPNQDRDTYEDVKILSHETSSEKDGTYLTSAESALSLSITSEFSSNNHCNPTDRTEITISQVAPSVCVNGSNAVLCGAPQTNVQNYLIEIIGNSLISDSSNIYMTSIIKSLGIQRSLTSNQQKEAIESMCDTVSTSVILEKIEQTQSEQILDRSNLLSIRPKPIQILSTSTHLDKRTSPTKKVSGNYLLTKEERQEDIVLEKPNAKVSQWSNTLKRKGPFVCNLSNPAQYRYQPDVQLRKKLRPYKCITLRKICLNPRTKNYTARAHGVSTITGALPNNVLISRTNKKEEKKKKDYKKKNTSEMASVKHQLLKTTKNISKRTDVNILDSCCQFSKQRKYRTSNSENFYWQDKSYVKKHSQRRKMHISKRKKANLPWKRKIVKIGDDRKRSLNTSLEKCPLSKSMHCDKDEANSRCKHLVKFKEQKLKNKIFLNTSSSPEALQFKSTDMLNNFNKSKVCEHFQLLTPSLMSNQNSTSTENCKKCQSAIQQVRQLKSEFHSKTSSKHKNELTFLRNQCDDIMAVDNRLQNLNHPKVFSKPRSNISVNEFNRSDPLINQKNISKSSSNQFYVFNYTKRSESSTNHVQRSESLVNHLKRSESSVVSLNRAKSLVNQLGGPKSLVKKIERPNTSVSKLCEPDTSVSKLCGPNTSVSKLCGPNTSVSKLCGPNTSVSKLSGPDTSVSKLSGPKSLVKKIERPNTSVRKLCRPDTSANLRQKSSVRQLEELKPWLNPCNSFKHSVTENNQSKYIANPRVEIQSESKKAQPLLDKASTTKISDVKEIEKKNTSLQKSLEMKDVFSRLWVSHSKCIGDISHLCCQLLKDVTNSSQICSFNINDIKRLWNLNKRFNIKCSNKLVNYGAESKKLDYCLKTKKAIDFKDASDNRGVIGCIQMILKKQSIALQAIDNVLQILQVPVQDIPEPSSRDDISNKFELREQLKHEKQNVFTVKHNERYFPRHRIIQKFNTCTNGNIASTSRKSLRTQQCNVHVSY